MKQRRVAGSSYSVQKYEEHFSVNLQFMLGILSSFLSFLLFLLAAGESVAAVAAELPLVPSRVTEGDGRKGLISPTGGHGNALLVLSNL